MTFPGVSSNYSALQFELQRYFRVQLLRNETLLRGSRSFYRIGNRNSHLQYGINCIVQKDCLAIRTIVALSLTMAIAGRSKLDFGPDNEILINIIRSSYKTIPRMTTDALRIVMSDPLTGKQSKDLRSLENVSMLSCCLKTYAFYTAAHFDTPFVNISILVKLFS